MAAFIIVVGILFNPFSAQAEEFHWGLKKATNGIPADAGPALNQCSINMVPFTKARLTKKLPI